MLFGGVLTAFVPSSQTRCGQQLLEYRSFFFMELSSEKGRDGVQHVALHRRIFLFRRRIKSGCRPAVSGIGGSL